MLPEHRCQFHWFESNVYAALVGAQNFSIKYFRIWACTIGWCGLGLRSKPRLVSALTVSPMIHAIYFNISVPSFDRLCLVSSAVARGSVPDSTVPCLPSLERDRRDDTSQRLTTRPKSDCGTPADPMRRCPMWSVMACGRWFHTQLQTGGRTTPHKCVAALSLYENSAIWWLLIAVRFSVMCSAWLRPAGLTTLDGCTAWVAFTKRTAVRTGSFWGPELARLHRLYRTYNV